MVQGPDIQVFDRSATCLGMGLTHTTRKHKERQDLGKDLPFPSIHREDPCQLFQYLGTLGLVLSSGTTPAGSAGGPAADEVVELMNGQVLKSYVPRFCPTISIRKRYAFPDETSRPLLRDSYTGTQVPARPKRVAIELNSKCASCYIG